jgi:magnesium transporter
MTARITAAALREYLVAHQNDSIRAALRHHHPADIADALAHLEVDDATGVLGLLPAGDQSAVFGYCPADVQTAIADRLAREDLAALLTGMSHDERADLFNRLRPDQQTVLLPGLAHAAREDIRRLTAYPEGTAGASMTSDYVTLPGTLAVRDALDRLRLEAPDAETIYNAYVVDEERRLQGVVSLRDLLLARDQTLVADIMNRDAIAARALDPREQAASLIARYDLLALPILADDGTLVGIVTADDAMDDQEEAATEDFHRLGALAPPHGAHGRVPVSLARSSLTVLYRLRIVWLVVLVFGNLFSGAGIAHFEALIASHVALVFFLPLLIDSGGNAGSQAATLVVRSLATGDVTRRDWRTLVAREMAVAVMLGLTMAVAVSVPGLARGGPQVALVVTVSMVVIVVVGSTVGYSLPFALSKLGLDPAAASAPLVTSVADALGVLIYFSIAARLLG